MRIAKVVGTVISTRKHPNLVGSKFLIVEFIQGMTDIQGNRIVAADTVGAGIGDYVMIVEGSTARKCFDSEERLVDTAIVGIIDDENDIIIQK
ncbi:MAG: ethanolamine utilization protein EutN [Clostridiales bacterium]|nr:ethanolamine utilization protein EutN [Clostridiales bacterium]MDK2933681.1 ethanolamine utilization protein EutN [Clostridiales bacterium]